MSSVNVDDGPSLTAGLSVAGLIGVGAGLGNGDSMRLGIALLELAIAEPMVSDTTVLIPSPWNSRARRLA
eukprot:5947953-Lingulodinium_polyedra.AAC.1